MKLTLDPWITIMDTEYAEHLTALCSARSTIAVKALPLGAFVKIEQVAEHP